MGRWKVAIGSALLVMLAGSLAIALTLRTGPGHPSPTSSRAFEQVIQQFSSNGGPQLVPLKVFCDQSGNVFATPLSHAELGRLSPRERSAWTRVAEECRQLSR
jgi:hypothetical protein